MANLQIVPASKNVEAQFVEMKVPLYSYGCEKKIKKALSHLRGIHSVHADYHLQKVVVWGICNKYHVLDTIRKKRREAHFWDHQTDGDTDTGAKEGTDADQEAEAKAGTDESNGEKAPHIAAMLSYRLKKSWKKLFPLVLHLK